MHRSRRNKKNTGRGGAGVAVGGGRSSAGTSSSRKR